MPKLFFQRPDELVLGQETAAAALARFPAAVRRVMDMHPEGNVAIVTHGTVLALYLAELSDEAPFALWRQMRLPSYAMVPWPADGGTEVVAQLTWWRGGIRVRIGASWRGSRQELRCEPDEQRPMRRRLPAASARSRCHITTSPRSQSARVLQGAPD